MLNELVHNIDDITEKKIAYVAMTQLIFISLVFLLLMGTIWHLRRKIYYPWMKLLSMVNAIGRKDFTQRFPMKNNRQDELNALGETLNHMSDELAQSYHQLEERVAEKLPIFSLRIVFCHISINQIKYYIHRKHSI